MEIGRTYFSGPVSYTHLDVYKRQDFDNKRLLLFSDNDQYLPYDITFEEIEEIWQYYAHIGFNDVKKSFNYMLEEKLNSMQYTCLLYTSRCV